MKSAFTKYGELLDEMIDVYNYLPKNHPGREKEFARGYLSLTIKWMVMVEGKDMSHMTISTSSNMSLTWPYI